MVHTKTKGGMRPFRSRKLTVLLAIVAVGFALAAATFTLKRNRELATVAEQVRHDADLLTAALKAHQAEFDQVIERASAIPELAEALSSHVDAVTLADLFDSEDWWAPYRKFGVAIFENTKLLVAREQGIPLGMQDDLVKKALSQPQAFSFAGDNNAFELFAKRLGSAKAVGEFVLVLSRPNRLLGLQHTPSQSLEARNAAVTSNTTVILLWILAAIAFIAAALSHLLARRPASASMSVDASVQQKPLQVVLPFPPSPAPAMPHQPTAFSLHSAQTFGRYNLLERIGEGGMSEIYAAVLSGAEGFQRYYAVKRLKPELAQNKAAVEQFIDEAKLGSQLVHSNIVPVFDFGRVGAGYFIAQEYIVGRNLGELMQRHRERLGPELSPSLACFIAHEVLEALAYAHDKTDDHGEPLNIVHRDVSSANIMVSLEGEVKLLDFGIVKASSRLSRTDLGNIKGNAAYMSPEQARGGAVDRRSDLFSLGVVFYHLLTGEQLYPGESTSEVFYKATTGPTSEHLSRIRGIRAPLGNILETALALDPNARFADGATFAEQLAPYVAGARAELATLMNAFFGAEIRRKTSEFRPSQSQPPSAG